MMENSSASFVLGFILAYPMFWLFTFNSDRVMRVYRSHDLNSDSDLVSDEVASFFSVGAAFWSLIFSALFAFGKDQCVIDSSQFQLPESAVGITAIALMGKCLFGSMTINHKRMLVMSDGELAQPLKWRLFDFVTSIPVYMFTAMINKAAWFALWSGLLLVSVWIGIYSPATSMVVPDYVWFPCFFFFLARVASIHIHKDDIPFHATVGQKYRENWGPIKRAIIYLTTLLSFVLTYSNLEIVLANCGAPKNALPSVIDLLLAMTTMSILGLFSGLVSVMCVSIFNLLSNKL